MKKEHGNYFSALEKHPRLLVGTEVPAIGKEGTERLSSTEDAREWQDAVKSLLVAEVRSRATSAMDQQADFLTTVHASIELFQNNTDLVPGTAEFDAELAERFTALAEPYELRVDGKLQGYSVPVQPLITQLRGQIAAERAKASAAPSPAAEAQAAAGSSTAAAAAQPGAPAASSTAEAPQAGIPSKAGGGAPAGEDYSVLFGTIGLPNLQI